MLMNLVDPARRSHPIQVLPGQFLCALLAGVHHPDDVVSILLYGRHRLPPLLLRQQHRDDLARKQGPRRCREQIQAAGQHVLRTGEPRPHLVDVAGFGVRLLF